ncbi:hypothetical protein ACFYT4_35665 [Streptomyces sp. NPDC004609]|uniref:hypothetical protein n=1 Tax=Streptomyces sp. NPDC004609 TaxID=3364704 RepID=UPI0036CCBB8A
MTSQPAPLGEPFAEALTEAAQSAAMAVRLILTVTDAVRRAARRHHCGTDTDDEPGLGEDAAKLAPGWAADTLRTTLPGDILTGLTASPAWPQLAGQLAALQHAGVDLTAFLPHLGTAAAVHQAVTANATAAGTAHAGPADRWAGLLRTTLPQGLVRDAILASPAWPDIADTLQALDDRGADVRRLLLTAHAQGAGVDRALAAAAAAGPLPASAAVPAQSPVPGPAAPGPVAPNRPRPRTRHRCPRPGR